ncbi:MAG: hypothetical protein ACI3ZL_04895 [Candidatus Cryptobacteroides sp.]
MNKEYEMPECIVTEMVASQVLCGSDMRGASNEGVGEDTFGNSIW